MRHRTSTLMVDKYYRLTKSTNPKNGKSVYTIHISKIADTLKHIDQLTMRKHFDPAGNRGPAAGWSWKYKNRADAEQLLMMAILKWSGTDD